MMLYSERKKRQDLKDHILIQSCSRIINFHQQPSAKSIIHHPKAPFLHSLFIYEPLSFNASPQPHQCQFAAPNYILIRKFFFFFFLNCFCVLCFTSLQLLLFIFFHLRKRDVLRILEHLKCYSALGFVFSVGFIRHAWFSDKVSCKFTFFCFSFLSYCIVLTIPHFLSFPRVQPFTCVPLPLALGSNPLLKI